MSQNNSTLPVQLLNEHARLPIRAHQDDAGLDLCSVEDRKIEPGQGTLIGTGIAVALPPGHVGLIADRSSMAKKGLKTAGGVIDAGYRGEIKVIFWNLSHETLEIQKGDRIAQLLILPVATPQTEAVESLDTTQRGEGGFGSTGK